MQRQTLSRFRAQWPAESMGICQADPRVRDYCNDAQERLMMDPLAPDEGWYGGWITLALTASNVNGHAFVTTPREIARLIVMGICEDPIHIRNGFYEYLKYGDGLQPKTCNQNCGGELQAFERDNVYTLGSLLTTAQTIRIYFSDVRDVGKRVLVQGKDNNGQVILTTDPGTGLSAPGEYIVIASPFADSVNLFSTISGLQKDETYGPITIVQVDPTTMVETALSSMEPTEGTALYRRYLINNLKACGNACCTMSPTVQITAQGRLDFIPVVNETDYLTIPNIPALIQECRSIRFSRMDSSAAAQQSIIEHGRAIAYLNGQMDTYLGKVQTAIRVPIFGSDRLKRQPV